jgi:RNA polymerase sigma-70 factor (ECF subfamily)
MDRGVTTHRISLGVGGGDRLAARAQNESRFADEQLLGAVATDRSALAALYERHAKRVYALARAILGCREEAEDLTQEVFVSVCEPTLYDRSRGTVGAFLLTMTRSRAIDRLRRRGRWARLIETWHEATPTTAPRTPLEDVSVRRAAELVRAVLSELPSAQRQVLELAYYEGLSQSEIATDLATPLGTVKTLSRRALLTLGRALEGPSADARRAASGDQRSAARREKRSPRHSPRKRGAAASGPAPTRSSPGRGRRWRTARRRATS